MLTAATQLRGDLDDDGNPSVNDAIGILRIVVGLAGPNPVADADGDGGTSVNDAIAVLRCVVGLAQWPLGEYTFEPTRTIGPGVVVDAEFVVGADENVECLGDTTIQCDTATITGELFTRSATVAGGDGPDITIEAQGDIVVTGAVNAGNGAAGADESDGGEGGDVTLRSVGGGITLGAEAGAGAATQQATVTPGLHAGDGGDGGDGESGGAGGVGGIITIDCSSGTLTVHQAAGLFHVGNGGDGGDAILQSVPGSGQVTGGSGGASGAPVLRSTALEGLGLEDVGEQVEGETAWSVMTEEGTVTGGVGGAGGDAGVDIVASSSARADAVGPAADTVVVVEGGKGEKGWREGGAGGSANADLAGQAMAAGEAGWDAEARGGSGGIGGHLDANYIGFIGALVVVFRQWDSQGGVGGEATAIGANGGAGGPCQPGGKGGNAAANGGSGGSVFTRYGVKAGQGGAAYALGGRGGNGGDCCEAHGGAAGSGGIGGAGGAAQAKGGYSGDFCLPDGDVLLWQGVGGAANARGGNGGDGGNGEPAGAGGSGGAATATGGKGPFGGDEIASNGVRGAAGGACPEPVRSKITGRVTDLLDRPLVGVPVSWSTWVTTNSAGVGALDDDHGSVQTGADGVFEMGDLADGTYWVEPETQQVLPSFWNPPMRMVTVAGADVPDQDFRIAAATRTYSITINVHTVGGAPVAGEAVKLIKQGEPPLEQPTNAAGDATFTNLWPGVYNGLPPGSSAYNYNPFQLVFALADQNLRQEYEVTPK